MTYEKYGAFPDGVLRPRAPAAQFSALPQPRGRLPAAQCHAQYSDDRPSLAPLISDRPKYAFIPTTKLCAAGGEALPTYDDHVGRGFQGCQRDLWSRLPLEAAAMKTDAAQRNR